MNNFITNYSFGNIIISISSPVKLKYNQKTENFLVSGDVSSDFQINVSLLPSTEICERISPPPVKRNGNEITVSLHENDVPNLSAANILSLVDAPFLFIEKNAFVLHSSFIIYKEEAILFSAPSGVGKSTHSFFWKEKLGAEIINGDRTLIYRDGDSFFAAGVYTSGSSDICENKTAPLKAIVLLEQGDENRVFSISPRHYLRKVIEEASYNVDLPHHCARITNLVSDVLSKTDVFCYSCCLDSNSATYLENYLWEKKKI